MMTDPALRAAPCVCPPTQSPGTHTTDCDAYEALVRRDALAAAEAAPLDGIDMERFARAYAAATGQRHLYVTPETWRAIAREYAALRSPDTETDR